MVCRAFLFTLFLSLFVSAMASAQGICPADRLSEKLVCVLPQVFGPGGLQQRIGALQGVPFHRGGHFEDSFVSNLTPLNTAVGSELTLLPVVSPGAGIVYTFDRSLGVYTASTEDFGPILSERAETIGRHKWNLGFSFQRFDFSTLDGADLKNLPAVFTHVDDPQDTTGNFVPVKNCTINPKGPGDSNTGPCGFVRDVISTRTRISLRLNQFAAYATYGLTRRFDVSLVVPIVNVRMNVTSDATIVDNSQSGDHQFRKPLEAKCPSPPGQPLLPECANESFFNTRNATGIGDVVLRGKYAVWRGERAGLAVGADLRLPSGDEQNFLGAGTVGFKPFAVLSYRARLSPHVNVGYEVNGDSTLAGDIAQGTSAHLPNQFIYSAGADFVIVNRRLASTFDLIGQRVLDARRVSVNSMPFLGACGPKGLSPGDPGYCTTPDPPVQRPTLIQSSSSFNATSAAIGVKFRPAGRLLVVGHVLVKLDDGGLRSRVVPLMGVSYTF
jgi:hypothetical protein